MQGALRQLYLPPIRSKPSSACKLVTNVLCAFVAPRWRGLFLPRLRSREKKAATSFLVIQEREKYDITLVNIRARRQHLQPCIHVLWEKEMCSTFAFEAAILYRKSTCVVLCSLALETMLWLSAGPLLNPCHLWHKHKSCHALLVAYRERKIGHDCLLSNQRARRKMPFL